jgi:hypothetical protein
VLTSHLAAACTQHRRRHAALVRERSAPDPWRGQRVRVANASAFPVYLFEDLALFELPGPVGA